MTSIAENSRKIMVTTLSLTRLCLSHTITPLRGSTLLLNVLLLMLCSTATTAAAGEVAVYVVLESPTPLKSIKGLEYTKEGITEIANVRVTKLDASHSLVVFALSSPEHLAGAVGERANGERIFSPLAKTSDFNPYALPPCSDPDLTYESLHDQRGTFRSLLEIRVQRRAVLKERVDLLLKQLSPERLARLEEGLGLSTESPPFETSTPQEVFTRSLRLVSAIRSFRIALERAKGEKQADK